MNTLLKKTKKNLILLSVILIGMECALVVFPLMMSGGLAKNGMSSVMVSVMGILVGVTAAMMLVVSLAVLHPLKKSLTLYEQEYLDSFDAEYPQRRRIGKTNLYLTKNYFCMINWANASVIHKQDIASFSAVHKANSYTPMMKELTVERKNGAKAKKFIFYETADSDVLGTLNDWLNEGVIGYVPSAEQAAQADPAIEAARKAEQKTDRKEFWKLTAVMCIAIAACIGGMWYFRGRQETAVKADTENSDSNDSSDYYDLVIKEIQDNGSYDARSAYLPYLSRASEQDEDLIHLSYYQGDGKYYIEAENQSEYLFTGSLTLYDSSGKSGDSLGYWMVRPSDRGYDTTSQFSTDDTYEFNQYVFVKLDYENPTFSYDADYDWNDSTMWTNIQADEADLTKENMTSLAKRYYAMDVLADIQENDAIFFYDRTKAVKDSDGYLDTSSASYGALLDFSSKTITLYQVTGDASTQIDSIEME